MPLNDIYYYEIQGLQNGILTRSTFHFKVSLPITTASHFVMYMREAFVGDMLPRISYSWRPTRYYARCVSVPLLDEFSFIENELAGEHPAYATDPRVCAYISLKGKDAISENFTGGLYWPGTSIVWAQEAPRLHDAGISQLQNWADLMINIWGHSGSNPFLRWGIFSRKNHAFDPLSEVQYWRAMQHARVRPWLAHLRSRRPRGLA